MNGCPSGNGPPVLLQAFMERSFCAECPTAGVIKIIQVIATDNVIVEVLTAGCRLQI